MLRTLAALACLAALAVATGCGESEQEQAREVAQDYVDASNEGDFEAVCELYSDEFIEQLGTTDCPAFVQENTSGAESELELVDVRVTDDVATAEIDVVSSDAEGPIRVGLRLQRQDGDWRISSLQ